MSTVYTTLEQVLKFRDERCELQRKMIREYSLPIISFTMNIAGPCKRNELIDFAFNWALDEILSSAGQPEHIEIRRCAAGSEAIAVFDRRERELKRIGTEIEDKLSIGRLLDIDVITPDGNKISRSRERRCIVCGAPVSGCARSRAHSLTEIWSRTEQILKTGCLEKIASLAVKALYDEVLLTPKPGLVDSINNGSHSDMDIGLMLKSADSLKSFFLKAAETGYDSLPDCAGTLQSQGIMAEAAMLDVTRGVNTHRGAIFSLGLLCAAVGANLSGHGDIFSYASSITAEIKPSDKMSHGRSAKSHYGAKGARGEAENGFPTVRKAVEMLRSGESALTVLMALIAETEDTNVLWRGGEEGLRFIRDSAEEILRQPESEREELVRRLDGECIRRNLSPGGAADLLGCALFVRSLDFSLDNQGEMV